MPLSSRPAMLLPSCRELGSALLISVYVLWIATRLNVPYIADAYKHWTVHVQDGPPVNCSEPVAPGARALWQFTQCGFVVMPQVLDPAEVRAFGDKWRAFVAEDPHLFTLLSHSAQPGQVIFDRLITHLPSNDSRFDDAGNVFAPPVLVALLDEYFGDEVEFDASTIIRNHGCANRPKCEDVAEDSPRTDGEGPNGYLWVNEDKENGHHRPCCNDFPQEFHRDLDFAGSIVVNIPLQDQREGYGPVRYCYQNKTGQGTHVSASEERMMYRTHDDALDVTLSPYGFVDYPEEYERDFYKFLEPLCNPERHTVKTWKRERMGERAIATPLMKVGDISMYEATGLHAGTSNTQDEDRDIIVLTFSWRRCPVAQSPNGLHDDWLCGECFHCASKEGWDESKYGTNGPDGQRAVMAANHDMKLQRMRHMLPRVRTTVEYIKAVQDIRRPL
eukprot:m.192203 g.192203  ORF g.192203 m.192203 type:complete len:445 (+) comp18587_c0_seq1:282-1616(+)